MMGRILLFAALCGVVATPAKLVAQSSTGSAATTVSPSEVFSKLLSDEEQEIVAAADAMPADKFNFAPTAGNFTGVRTYAQQIKHITEANYSFFHDWDIPNGKTRADIEKLTTKDDLMQALRASFAYALAGINTISAENAFEPMGAQKMTRAGVATHAIAHPMDHYGQMVEYLRMNGIIPPASRR